MGEGARDGVKGIQSLLLLRVPFTCEGITCLLARKLTAWGGVSGALVRIEDDGRMPRRLWQHVNYQMNTREGAVSTSRPSLLVHIDITSSSNALHFG